MQRYLLPSNTFFIAIQLVSAMAFVYALAHQSGIELWLLSLCGYFLITCLGITVTFHRLLAHRAYKLAKPLEYLFSLFGNLGCTGSSLGWTFVHRRHHRYADKPGDPHSPKILGPIGAIIGDYSAEFNKWDVKDIVTDPFHRFMHRYYTAIVLAVPILLSLIDPIYAIHLFFIPVFFNTIASRMSNWIDHASLFGSHKRSYTKDSSHNVWWWSYVTFGEGWHNNHHGDPGNYRIGKKWWQFDPGKYVINTLMLLRLAHQTRQNHISAYD